MVGLRNAEAWVERSLAGVLGQAGVSLEVIAVDDGSDDDTPQLLGTLSAADPRLRVLRQDKAGLTCALIRGCALARAPIIARHDADDTSLPGRLAAQLHLLRSNRELAFVSCWSRAVGPEKETLWENHPAWEPEAATRLLLQGRQGPPGHGTVMMRRDAYERAGGYRAPFYFGQDADLWLRLVDQGAYALVPRILYEYSVDPRGISSTRRSIQVEYGRLARACRTARQGGEPEQDLLAHAAALKASIPLAQPEQAWRGPYFIGRCLARRRDRRALKYLTAAVRLGPLQPRAWLALLAAVAGASAWGSPAAGRGGNTPSGEQ